MGPYYDLLEEASLRDCIGQRDCKKGDHYGEAQHT